MGGQSSKALLSRDEDARAFLHIAPSERDAFRFATIGLNLPDGQSYFTPWDLLAEVRSFMEHPNYVVLVGITRGLWRGPSDKWVPLLTTDTAKEFEAICSSNAGSRAHLVLCAVTSIGHRFLFYCKLLTTLDLSGPTAVTSIGDSFLEGCSSLTTIDLSGLTAVTSIDGSFLFRCSSLQTINMSGLTAVTSIGTNFIEGCTSLTTVNMSPAIAALPQTSHLLKIMRASRQV